MHNSINRRKFLHDSALAGGAMMFLPLFNGCRQPDASISGNYFLNEFGIDESLCRKLLEKALSKGGDFADLYFEFKVSNNLGLEDGKVTQSAGNISLGMGVRTVKGDQTGYGFTQDLTEESMMSAATTASTICALSATFPSQFQRMPVGNYYPLEPDFNGIQAKSKLPLLQDLNQKCFSLSPEIVKVSASFSSSLKRMYIVTSDGVETEDIIPHGYISANVTADRNGRKEQSGWNLGGRRDFSYYTDDVINKVASIAVNNAVSSLDAIQPPAGEMPVVLGPGVPGILLHEAIGHGMEADFNRKKTSTYATMLGKKVAEPFVTIIDDGTNMNMAGSINVDDEGTPGQKTVLVDKGILVGYLHDKISAKYYGVAPTGNGRRQDYQNYPLPRMRNTYMQPGDALPEDIIKTAGNGIYVEDVANGQVDIGAGDFAFYVSRGKLIENGKLTKPIKDINIMGNGPKMLENIIMAGNDLKMYEGGSGYCGKGQRVTVGFGLPTCLVKSLTVGGTRQKGGIS
ncbi:MAG TPA: TldD/PmbA family protein [Bacteroidales bacterium]|nr:TldD/PmbA family protein [Bacteroidales bacterium]